MKNWTKDSWFHILQVCQDTKITLQKHLLQILLPKRYLPIASCSSQQLRWWRWQNPPRAPARTPSLCSLIQHTMGPRGSQQQITPCMAKRRKIRPGNALEVQTNTDHHSRLCETASLSSDQAHSSFILFIVVGQSLGLETWQSFFPIFLVYNDMWKRNALCWVASKHWVRQLWLTLLSHLMCKRPSCIGPAQP